MIVVRIENDFKLYWPCHLDSDVCLQELIELGKEFRTKCILSNIQNFPTNNSLSFTNSSSTVKYLVLVLQ
jgi:hypothetical protein